VVAGAADAQAATLYAYATGAGTPSGCPLSSPSTGGCSLATALSDAAAGDTVKLESPGQTAGGADYIGNWSIGTTGTSGSKQVTIDGGDVTGATLNGNSGSATGCTTAACNGSVLTVKNSMFLRVENMKIINGSSAVVGGGLQNDQGGTVAIAAVTFSNDTAAGEGGAVANGDFGGSGSVTISGSTFTGNSAQYGGAVDTGDNIGSGSVTISDSTFTGNSAGHNGGAIDNGDQSNGLGSGPWSVSITGSTFSGNTATGDGGAIDNADQNPHAAAAVTVADSTLTGDTATAQGGEIDTSDNGQGVLVVSASTLDAGASGSDIVAGHNTGLGKVFVAGNVFAHGCQHIGGTWTDGGYEVGADATCFNGGTGDVNAGSAGTLQLGSLADNGGATKTMAVPAGSPEVGIIPSGTTPSLNGQSVSLCPGTDQRGAARPGGGKTKCDAGAFESRGSILYAYAAGASTTSDCPLTTTGSLQCSLQRALSLAGAGETVKLESPGHSAGGTDFVGNWSIGTTGTSGSQQVTIDGGDVTGATLNGNAGVATGCTTAACNGPVLTVTNGMFLKLENLSITHGDNVLNELGGGLQNNHGGTVTVASVAFTNDKASFGGAVDNADNGTGSVTISDSAFTNNAAGTTNGGAIDNGDQFGSGSVTISGSTFTGNTAGVDGGAIDNGDNSGSGSVTISDSTFAGNTSSWDGGAVDNGDGFSGVGSGTVSVTVTGSTFSTDIADRDGGAIDNADDNPNAVTVTVSDSTLSGDSAVGQGGEIDTSDNGQGVLVVSASTLDAGGSGSDIVAGHVGLGQVFVAGNVFAHGCHQAGGAWSDRGYEAGADATCFNGGTGDANAGSVAALDLGPLANNGGATPTMALETGSSAAALIPVGTTVSLNGQQVPLCPGADQRGEPRPAAGATMCDAGAYESQPLSPSSQISTPTSGEIIKVGSAVTESFACSEGTGGPGVASCVDANGHPTGASLDTSTLGSHHVTVTATSRDGLTGTATVDYTVAAAPSVQITTPTAGAVVTQGAVVDSEFTCTEGASGPGIATCVDQSGKPSGSALDTHTVGSHTLTVTATSQDGFTTTGSVTYTVVTPPHLRLSELRLSRTRFHAARKGPSTSARPNAHTGTTIAYADSLAASTTILILRCTGPHGRCSKLKPLGSLTHKDTAGTNTVNFTGRVHNKALTPGHYVFQLVATGNGLTSTTVTAGFTILFG
jgi:hypothetical protein